MLTYSAELKPQQEGGYTVTVPVLPGCISEGDTFDEALTNIKDAVEGYIKTMVKQGKRVPLEFSEFKQIEVFSNKTKTHVT